jgi:hypothetical protein
MTAAGADARTFYQRRGRVLAENGRAAKHAPGGPGRAVVSPDDALCTLCRTTMRRRSSTRNSGEALRTRSVRSRAEKAGIRTPSATPPRSFARARHAGPRARGLALEGVSDQRETARPTSHSTRPFGSFRFGYARLRASGFQGRQRCCHIGKRSRIISRASCRIAQPRPAASQSLSCSRGRGRSGELRCDFSSHPPTPWQHFRCRMATLAGRRIGRSFVVGRSVSTGVEVAPSDAVCVERRTVYAGLPVMLRVGHSY